MKTPTRPTEKTTEGPNGSPPPVETPAVERITQAEAARSVAEGVVFDVTQRTERIGAFVRVSTGHQTLELQKAAIEEVAKRNHHRIAVWFEEAAVSGAAKHRPVMVKLLEQAAAGKVSMLYFTALDRLGRSAFKVCEILSLLNKYQVRLVSLREQMDTSTAFGRGMVMLALIFADMEREFIRARTNAGFQKWRTKGGRPGTAPSVWTRGDDALLVGLVQKGLGFKTMAKMRLFRLRSMRKGLLYEIPSFMALRRRYERLVTDGKAPAMPHGNVRVAVGKMPRAELMRIHDELRLLVSAATDKDEDQMLKAPGPKEKFTPDEEDEEGPDEAELPEVPRGDPGSIAQVLLHTPQPPLPETPEPSPPAP